MGDQANPDRSSDPSGKRSSQKTSADSSPEHAEAWPRTRTGRKRRTRTSVNQMFPAPRPSEGRLTSPLPGIVLFLFLLGVAVLSILLLRPPAPLSATAPADQFSAERALAHIQALATQPRPVGSPAHAKAEAYLVEQLRELGLEPQVQKAVSVRDAVVANVENVLARLPGSRGGGKAILLNAHYDSVATGLGASDDGSGVATLLETARALKATSTSLANDVIFLFTDGEEQGWMGASAFVEEHPWANDVGVALVFDAAILTGPQYLAAAGPNDGWLISQFAQAAPYPVAGSLVAEYRRQLNIQRSDFDAFVAAGYPALMFSGPGDHPYYHTLLDAPANVELDSLQHQGAYALALVRQFGDVDLTAAQGGNAVYFNVFGSRLLVHYPQSWVIPLVVLAVLVWIGATIFGLRKRQVSVRGILLGALASLLLTACLAAAGYLLWRLLLVVYPQYDPIHFEAGADTYNGIYYWLAFMALGVGLAALMQSGLRTRIRGADLAFGALLLWLVLAVAASVAFPGVSYAFTWPLLFAGAGLWGWLVLGRTRRVGSWGIVWLALFTVPAMVLVPPAIYVAYVGESVQQIWMPMAILGLLVALLTPHLGIMTRPRKSWLPTLMGLVVVGFLVAGHVTSDYTSARPLRDGIYYGLSADEDQAYWVGAFDTGIDPYTEQFLGEDGREGDYRNIFPWEHETTFYEASAPLVDLPVPRVEELDGTDPGVFRLHVVPAPGTAIIDLFAMPGPVPGMIFYVDGRPMESEGLLVYWAPPAEGFDLTVASPGLDTLTLRVVNSTMGLPTLTGFSYEPRPDWIIPTTKGIDDSTVFAKTFVFEKG